MILGREKEKAILSKLLKSKRAEFLAIYGRRRIGKTYLIHEFFKDKGVYLEVTGSNKATKKEQLKNFHREYQALFPEAIPSAPPEEWSDLFNLLLLAIQKIDPEVRFILFIDELPWLASPKSGFLAALDYFWNRHLSRLPNVLLIVCGSAAHWIIKKVVNDKGGLHGRLSAQIPLQAFNLEESEKFVQEQGIRLKRKQVVELYMGMGGVAKYMLHLPLGKSSTQIINDLCFSSQGPLFSEFPKLYESLFDASEKHIAIVRALAKRRHGINQKELLKEVGISQGGGASDILDELEASGFIMSMPAYGKQTKERAYRLIDEYSLFYLTWIEGIKGNILRSFDQEYWNKMWGTPAWYAWAGYAFESICLKHSGQIKKALGIAGVTTAESHWQYVPPKSSEDTGAEIDLIIDRADNCIHLCEMKFCDSEFIIDKAYAKKLEQKKEIFQKITGTHKTLFLTLITPYGVKENEHYIGLIDQQLTIDSLFSTPIPL